MHPRGEWVVNPTERDLPIPSSAFGVWLGGTFHVSLISNACVTPTRGMKRCFKRNSHPEAIDSPSEGHSFGKMERKETRWAT